MLTVLPSTACCKEASVCLVAFTLNLDEVYNLARLVFFFRTKE